MERKDRNNFHGFARGGYDPPPTPGIIQAVNVSLTGMKNVRTVEDSEIHIVNSSTLIKADRQTNELKIQLS